MKILWLSHLVPYPPKGGVLQRSYNLLREISRYHEVTLVAFNQETLLKDSLPGVDDPLKYAGEKLGEFTKSVTFLDIPEHVQAGGRYRVALKALLTGKAYNMAWLDSAVARARIKQLVDSKSFDAVHIDTISLCVYADLFENLPVYLNHHNVESSMLLRRAELSGNPVKKFYFSLEARLLRSKEKHFAQRVVENLTCSEDDAIELNGITGKSNSVCIPNGVDCDYFYPNNEVTREPETLIFAGGLTWYPNQQAMNFLIDEVWPLLKKEVPDIRMNLVGRNPTPKFVDMGRVDENFVVHGFVDDVRDYLWSSQIYICPIKDGGGTKLKILDALACGCCVVADPFACKGIAVEDGKNVVFASTPAEYVEKIKLLIENRNMRAKLERYGPELIRNKYSYDAIGKRYANILSGAPKHKEATSHAEKFI